MARNIVSVDAGQEVPRLEVIRCPLYDTQYQEGITPASRREGKGFCFPDVAFFYGKPAGLSTRFTNCEVRGQLPWPKRFFCTAIKFLMERDPGMSILNELTLSLKVGDRIYFQQPITAMSYLSPPEASEGSPYHFCWESQITTEVDWCDEKPEGSDWKPPALGIYIPPVQGFYVNLETNGLPILDSELRVVLDGVLMREMQ
jgi:hypothetical protein